MTLVSRADVRGILGILGLKLSVELNRKYAILGLYSSQNAEFKIMDS